MRCKSCGGCRGLGKFVAVPRAAHPALQPASASGYRVLHTGDVWRGNAAGLGNRLERLLTELGAIEVPKLETRNECALTQVVKFHTQLPQQEEMDVPGWSGPPAPNREEPMTTISVTIAPESKIKVDPSSDVYRSETHPLDALFLPQSVAVVGASERPGSVGRSVLWNLLSSPFGGTVFPINSKRPNVLGIKAYPSLTDLPDKVDLVVVSTPAGNGLPDSHCRSSGAGNPGWHRDPRPASKNTANMARSWNGRSHRRFAARCGSSAPTALG